MVSNRNSSQVVKIKSKLLFNVSVLLFIQLIFEIKKNIQTKKLVFTKYALEKK